MTDCKCLKSYPCVILLILFLMAATAPAQQNANSAKWTEGANVKINHDASIGLQNEAACAILPSNPDNAVAIWRDFRLGFRRIGVGTTADAGSNWSDSLLVGTTSYPRASDPVMSYTADGDILACVLSLSPDESISAIHVYRSTNAGASWSAPLAAVDDGGASGFEDKQWINVDRTNSPFRNRVYIPWTRFGANTNIMLVYNESPSQYSQPVQVSDFPSVQWPSVAIGPDGTVYVAWISFYFGRIMIDRSYDGGSSFNIDGTVTSIGLTNNVINGGILVFAYPAMDIDISGGVYSGNVYIAYSDYAADGDLDLFVRRSTDQGFTWSSPVRINDDPIGNHVDQFHPWITVDEDGILTATWLDRRLDPNNYNWDTYMAHSFDGGQTWTANRRISEVSSSPSYAAKQTLDVQYAALNLPGKPAGEPYNAARSPMAGLIGEYLALSTRSGMAQVIWPDTRNGNQDVYSARVTIGFSAPPLYLPAKDAITNNNQPTFHWGNSGASPAQIAQFPNTKVQPLHYVLQVDDDSLFGSIDFAQSGIATTSHQFAGVIPDGLWFWRVYAVNDSGRTTGFSEPGRRLTIDTQAPALPTILKPEPDSLVDYQTQVYQWTAVLKLLPATPVKYQIQISQDSTFVTAPISVANLSTTTYTNSVALLPDATYYCRVSATDAATNTSGFTAPRRFHTRASYVCGDADHSGAVDISDAVYLIAYIFSGGAAPNPLAAGDPDCSGSVDISDVVFLIAYIFSGGPAPCSAC